MGPDHANKDIVAAIVISVTSCMYTFFFFGSVRCIPFFLFLEDLKRLFYSFKNSFFNPGCVLKRQDNFTVKKIFFSLVLEKLYFFLVPDRKSVV